MNKSAYFFLFLALSSAVVNGRSCPNPPVVKNFNVKAYMGVWYEIASSALQHGIFERNCYCSTAQYEIVNASTVSVVNSCAYGGPTNTRVEVIGNAYVSNVAQPAKLYVEFNSSFIPSYAKSPYWVLDVASDYSYALVWSCIDLFEGWDLENAFILSRNPTLDSYTYSKLLNKLQALTGHNPDDMVQQIQGGSCNYQNPSSETFVTVTTSQQRANFKGVFIINTKAESAYDSGPMFAGDGEEGILWMRMINYVRLQNTAKAVHNHPLTQMSAIKPKIKGPSVIIIKSNDVKNCSTCDKGVNPKEAYCCEFCNVPTNKEHFFQCSDCYKGFRAFEVPFINSPDHNHQLMKLTSKQDLRWAYEVWKFDCSKCSKQIKSFGYHCIECEQWTECDACASASTKATSATTDAQNAVDENNSGTMRLDVNLLQPAMKIEGNKYSLNSVKAYRCPQVASIITNNSWNLSQIDSKPADNAYFEVTFNKISEDGVVSVGIGNQIFVQNQMLGYQQNSFGYLNNGSALQNIGTNLEQLEGYDAGDTIGCGVLLDSYNQRHVFYTKNGQLVGVFKGTLHRGMDCFPGVSFTRISMVEFVANLEGPFKFDLSSVPDYRNDRQNRLDALPIEILSLCISHSVSTKRDVAQLVQISKQCCNAAKSNEVWKPLFLQQWPLQSAKLKIKSWYTLYKRRYAVERTPLKLTSIVSKQKHFIENCEMEFECPLIYEKLNQKENESGSRYCYKCEKTVYEVSDVAQLREFSEMGRCVALVEQVKMTDGPALRRPLMGSIRAPPKKIPPPFQK